MSEGAPASGRVAQSKAKSAEGAIAWVRQAVIAFNSIVYLWFMPPGSGIPPLAWAVIGVANTYGLYVIIERPYERWPVMATSTFTSVTDGVLITVWLIATGGVASPFHLLWYSSLMAVAFRYDIRATVYATISYAIAYLGVGVLMGQVVSHWFDLTVRIGYILLVGALGALLARDSSRVIEDRVRLEERLEQSSRLRTLAEATTEGLCIHVEGRVQEVNPGFCRLFGRDRKDIIGAHVLEFVAPESATDVSSRLKRPQDEPYEAWLQRDDGSQFLAKVQGRDYPFEGTAARVVTVRDVTQERAAEEARQLARARDDEVHRLERMNALKLDFINTAAHELNTPLTPIRLQLHMLRRNAEHLDEKDRNGLEMLDRNLGRLAGLVRDMLDMARIQAGNLRLEIKEIELPALIETVITSFAGQARAQDVTLVTELGDDLELEADPERLEQVLGNLLANALHYTPSGGTVRLEARRMVDEIMIQVIDTGQGMDSQAQRDLFQPMVSHSSTRPGGLGIGLFICKGLVERHGGQLTVSSDGEGKGTTATVYLPVQSSTLAEPMQEH